MNDSSVIEAAGGLVWRDTPRGKEIALVHRPRYNDWTLPKGKREKNESWEQSALREVREETGLIVRLGDFAGSTSYLVGNRPKIVLFWHMYLGVENAFVPNEEVDELQWANHAVALVNLSYESERVLLAQYNP